MIIIYDLIMGYGGIIPLQLIVERLMIRSEHSMYGHVMMAINSSYDRIEYLHPVRIKPTIRETYRYNDESP